MESFETPKIANLQEITPELFREYVTFVETMRHNQTRWFKLRNFDALHIAQEMERKIDALNAVLLDATPKLF